MTNNPRTLGELLLLLKQCNTNDRFEVFTTPERFEEAVTKAREMGFIPEETKILYTKRGDTHITVVVGQGDDVITEL